jgi:hypothetical protein
VLVSLFHSCGTGHTSKQNSSFFSQHHLSLIHSFVTITVKETWKPESPCSCPRTNIYLLIMILECCSQVHILI